MNIHANGIAIEVEDSHPASTDRPVVLLIMGLGMQLVAWPVPLVQALLDAGYRVIRYDNRDVGLSQHFDELGMPNLVWAALQHKLGFTPSAPYSVQDMANDALGVLDAQGVARAHVVGISMGGMIAQRVALTAPERVLSLTSVMSSSGARDLPGPDTKVVKAMLSSPASTSPHDVTEHYLQFMAAVSSPGYAVPESILRDSVMTSVLRSFRPVGTLRQTLAVMADTRRADELPRIQCPTLVVHGVDDPLVPLACGEDTARRIPGAQFYAIPGMGHDLPPGVVTQLLTRLLPHLRAATPPKPDLVG
jgi:pimeloyl-ACP methyl ester carboxylesterase